ncbi:hypothetical protein V8D89_012168 [Ganoderma adspersum]
MIPLPSELLELIVDNLEREDQKTYRLLSKLHHDFATRALFTHVNVYFGQWMVYSRLSQSDETVAELQHKNNVTWEILHHISFSPNFAKVVKEVTVFAYLPLAGKGLGGDIFHIRTLIAALHALLNLRAFRWHGNSPAPGQAVLETLVQSSGPSLEQLCIPMTAATLRCLSAFSRLRELCSVDGDFYSSLSVEDPRAHALHLALDGMARTLTRVSVVGDAIWGCSVRSMVHLQELEIVLPGTAAGLDLVFKHCVSLHSLTLFTRARDEFLSVLQRNPAALPDLRVFKFIYWLNQEAFGDQQAQTLATFIKSKGRLTLLDVEIRGQGYDMCDRPLLEAIAQLPHLEVLGFTLVRSAWEQGDIQFFREHLPQRLAALRVSVCLNEAHNTVFPSEWLDLIKGLHSLRYLHIFDRLGTSYLEQQVLEDPHPSIDLFGYAAFLRWTLRDHGDDRGHGVDRPKFSRCWLPSKFRFRSAEDFGCAEWEWLLRWYNDDLTPGLFDWSALHRASLREGHRDLHSSV